MLEMLTTVTNAAAALTFVLVLAAGLTLSRAYRRGTDRSDTWAKGLFVGGVLPAYLTLGSVVIATTYRDPMPVLLHLAAIATAAAIAGLAHVLRAK